MSVAVRGAEGARLRLAELVAALSLGVDLGFGQPMEHVLRQCLIALRMADRLGVDDDERVAVYYVALLVSVACHTDAHEQAKWFGDDIKMKSTKYDSEMKGLRGALAGVRMIGAGLPPLHRFRVVLEFAISGHREVDSMIAEHAARGRAFGEMLGLPENVLDALAASYERWDGKGWPGRLRGDGMPLAARLAQLAEYIEVAHRIGGVEAARKLASERSGAQFDPALAKLVQDDASTILDGLDDLQTWNAVIDAEPRLTVTLIGDEVDAALTAVANFVDMKSPYTLGHSPAVSRLAIEAGRSMGLDRRDLALLGQAGLVHDFGRLGVSNAIWDKRGPLGAGEWERVRFYPYLTDRMLRQSRALAPLGSIAMQHLERLDGSGYPGGLSGGAISRSGRLLGAADAYQAMREPRPHRPALDEHEAASQLRREARSGRLDADAVEAVLGAAVIACRAGAPA